MASRAASRDYWRFALPAVVLLGAVLRILHLIALSRSPLFDLLQWDAGSYDLWARDIAGGKLIGDSAFWQDPLYAYVLGFAYRIFGHHLLVPRVLALACGLVTIVCTARIAERVWQSRGATLAAALIAGCYLPEILYEGIIGKTALSVCLLAGALDAFTIGTRRSLVASGVLLGLGALARGNLLLLLPLAVLVAYRRWQHDPEPNVARDAGPRDALRVLFGAVPCLALATLHNGLAAHEFVPLTTNLGINLYLANHDGNEYGYYTPPAFLPVDSQNEIPSFRAEAERRTGASFTDRELSSYWTDETLSAVLASPMHAAVLTWRKLRLLLHDDEVSDADSLELTSEWSPVLKLPLTTWGELFPLAVLGGVIGFQRRSARLTVGVAVGYFSSLLPFFVLGRLRVQLLAPLAVLAAGALVWLVESARAQRSRALFVAAAGLLPCLVLASYRAAWMERVHRAGLAVNWNNLGTALAESGKKDAALAAFQRAVAIDAEAVPAALRALGALYEQRADDAQALDVYQRLLELKPQSVSAQAAVRRVQSRISSAPAAALPGPRAEAVPTGTTPIPTSTSAAASGAPNTDAGVGRWTLTSAARAALIARLAGEPVGSATWISFDGRDEGARALARDLGQAFEQAHWKVAQLAAAPMALRPGLSLFAAGEATPTYTAVDDALQAAGLEAHSATGYLDFARDRAAHDPSYHGLTFAEGQDFVLVVGRHP
jgi:tetratricopeptide (TPR) repeat protein